jgi:hypothetical protein
MRIDRAVEFARNVKYNKIRLGYITRALSVPNPNPRGAIPGTIDVQWLDGEIGGQTNVPLNYPAFNNRDENPWGMELGISEGMIGVFGFDSSNISFFLGAITSQENKSGTGYQKKRPSITGFDDNDNPTYDNGIKSGEFRIRSQQGATVYWDTNGNLITRTYRQQIPANPNTVPPTPAKPDLKTLAVLSITDPAGNMTVTSFKADGVTPSCILNISNAGSISMTGVSSVFHKFGPDSNNFTQVTSGMQDDNMGILDPADPNDPANFYPITHDIYSTGDIQLRTPKACLIIDDNGISIEAGTNPDGSTSSQGVPKLTVGGNLPVLYSKRGAVDQPIEEFNQIGVSNTVYVGGDDTVVSGDDQCGTIPSEY